MMCLRMLSWRSNCGREDYREERGWFDISRNSAMHDPGAVSKVKACQE
jgi:hypothetical protein